MPVVDPNEAKDLDEAIERLLRAGSDVDREARLRSVFVEKLDFSPAGGVIDLRGERCPVKQAARIAEAEGVHVVWAPLSSVRILISDTRAVSKALTGLLGDHLLVASSENGRVWHLVYPASAGAKPILRRMVVERGLPRRTVVTQLAKVYHEAQKTDVRHALESAYDVEPVTKEFFTTYRAVFERVMEMVEGVPDAEGRRLFCQALFNRLMFLYFLQRKGWLRFNGESNYLPALLRASKAAGNENFFRDRLKTLFFAGLNKPQSVDVTRGASAAIGEVPFLNGGLFEKGDIDLECANADVPNEAFDAILGGLFERFNFTVSENTPYDIEVAVDPEMLGKVFEEVVTGRHETGSYYTPRPVVAFMCREALKGYLETKVPVLSADAIRKFVDEHNVEGLDLTQAGKVAEALDEVTVCDPACGSGAYLVGMLHELIELKQALYSERLGRDPTKLYDMKLHIIERNLYGADLDEFAINIAMLRLWLSLIIDFDGPKPLPLPNLDFKIVCGDSLTAPNPQHAPDLFRHVVHEAAGKLADLKGRYLRESGPDKPGLKTQIEDAERELQKALAGSPAPIGSVDWRLEFAEVFDTNGGFDIVVANPPYRRHELIPPATKALLLTLYPETGTARSDIYVYFYHRGLDLLRAGGMHVFVCSNSWLDVGYGAKLQEFLLKRAHVLTIYESSVERQFSTANVNTIISVVKRVDPDDSQIVSFVSLRRPFESAIADIKGRREVRKSRGDLWSSGLRDSAGASQRFQGDKWGGKYLRAPDVYWTIVERARGAFVPLATLADVRFGVKTGADDWFYLTARQVDELGIERQFLKPMLTDPGDSNVSGIIVTLENADRLVIDVHLDPDQLAGTNLAQWIQAGESRPFKGRGSASSIPATRPTMASRKRWYQLPERRPAPILWIETKKRRSLTLLNQDGLLADCNFSDVLPKAEIDERLLCALMNSTVVALYCEIQGNAPGGSGAGVKMPLGEIRRMAIPHPAKITSTDRLELLEAFASMCSRPIGPIYEDVAQADRQALDAVIFSIIGLGPRDVKELHMAVSELIEARLTKAASRVTG